MKMDNLLLRKCSTYLLLLILNLSIVLSVSYQQNRFFSLDRTLGMDDAHSYISMSKGDYNVNSVHSRRFLIPELVKLSRPLLVQLSKSFAAADEQSNFTEISYRFSFWIINSILMAIAGLFLYLSLESLKINPIYSLFGSTLFLTSRVTTYTAGTPLVDSVYLLGISIFCFALIKQSTVGYILSSVFLTAFTKENAILIPFLPLLSNKYRSILYYLTAFLSAFAWIVTYSLRGGIILGGSESENGTTSVLNILINHFPEVVLSVGRIFTFSGFYDLIHGYGALILFAIIGIFYNSRRQLLSIPLPIIYLIPLSLLFALLSGNLGRMFYGAFVPIISYALIGIYAILPKNKFSDIKI